MTGQSSTPRTIRSSQRSARRRWMFRIFSITFASIVAVLLAETTLRLFVPDTRSPYIYDEFTGTRLEPGHQFVFQSEGFSSNIINSQGLRDREHTLQKPTGTFRIAVLGDSFSEAFQVAQENTFWSILERELQSMPEFKNQTVEVINFGVSGFGTTQQWQMLEHYVGEYSPDLVLLAFLPGNDVRNNSRQLETDQRRPFAKLIDGKLQLDFSFRDDPNEKRFREFTWSACKDQAIRRSRVVHLLYRTLENWRSRTTSQNTPNAGSTSTDEAGIDSAVFAPPKTDAWRDAWEITDHVLQAMQSESKTIKAEFVVVILNNSVEVHPDPEVTLSLAKKLGAADLNEPQRRIIASGQRYGFSVINLLEPMQKIAHKDHVYFHGFPNTQLGTGHWNEAGHATAGKLIAQELARLLKQTASEKTTQEP